MYSYIHIDFYICTSMYIKCIHVFLNVSNCPYTFRKKLGSLAIKNDSEFICPKKKSPALESDQIKRPDSVRPGRIARNSSHIHSEKTFLIYISEKKNITFRRNACNTNFSEFICPKKSALESDQITITGHQCNFIYRQIQRL